jgi:acylglycerol lipase
MVSLPLLVIHGTADTMAAPQASIDLDERAASTDKTLHLVSDGYHALLRDLDRDQTLETIVQWIDERRGTSRSGGGRPDQASDSDSCSFR